MPLEAGYDPTVAQEGVLAVFQLAQHSCKPVRSIPPSPGMTPGALQAQVHHRRLTTAKGPSTMSTPPCPLKYSSANRTQQPGPGPRGLVGAGIAPASVRLWSDARRR